MQAGVVSCTDDDLMHSEIWNYANQYAMELVLRFRLYWR
jgi:hypothetical protein